jgi:hypothetical protein
MKVILSLRGPTKEKTTQKPISEQMRFYVFLIAGEGECISRDFSTQLP